MSVHTDSSPVCNFNAFDFAVGMAYQEHDISHMFMQDSASASFADSLFWNSASDSSNNTSPSSFHGSPHVASGSTFDYNLVYPISTPFDLPSYELSSSIHDQCINWDPLQSDAGAISHPADEAFSETSPSTSVYLAELSERLIAPLPTRSHYVVPSSPSSHYDTGNDNDSEDNRNDRDYESESDVTSFLQTSHHKRARSSKVPLAPEAKRPRTESRKLGKQRGRTAKAFMSTETDDEDRSASSSDIPPPSSLPRARKRAPAPRRNKIAEGRILEEITSMFGDGAGAKQKRFDSRFRCPRSCSWTQGKERMPEFVCHLKTHLPRANGKHVCHCGEGFSRLDAMRRHQRNSCGNR